MCKCSLTVVLLLATVSRLTVWCVFAVFQINSTYLQSLPRDCCLICHAPRVDSKSQPCCVSDTTGHLQLYLSMLFEGIG